MKVLRAGLPDVACSPRTVSLGAERALGRDTGHCGEKAGSRRRSFTGFGRRKSGLLTGEMEVCLGEGGRQRNCFRL